VPGFGYIISNQSASNSDGTPSIFNMKIVVVLFCSLAICSSEWQKHGSNLEQQNSRSLFRSHLFSCANEEMMPLVRKCKNEIRFQMGKESRQREDCSRKSEQPDDQVTIDNCRFETKRERMGLTTDCFLMNIGAMNRSTKTIDSAIQKQFSIDSSTLSDAEKADAAATFDDCMAADYTRPYKRFAFRPENFPEPLTKVLDVMNDRTLIGSLDPEPSTVAVFCMATALLQNVRHL